MRTMTYTCAQCGAQAQQELGMTEPAPEPEFAPEGWLTAIRHYPNRAKLASRAERIDASRRSAPTLLCDYPCVAAWAQAREEERVAREQVRQEAEARYQRQQAEWDRQQGISRVVAAEVVVAGDETPPWPTVNIAAPPVSSATMNTTELLGAATFAPIATNDASE